MNVVAVLQKPMQHSKSRLKHVFSPKQRVELVRAMLSDVLSVLSKTSIIDHYGVLSCDPQAIQLAKRFGASVFYEEKAKGINQAIDQLVKKLDHKYTTLCILPSDIPLITPKDIENVITNATITPVTIAPCKNGTGTNALVLNPPTIIRPQFGVNSKEKHVKQARLKNVPFVLHHCCSLQQDVDTVSDLVMFNKVQLDTYTKEFLSTHRLIKTISFQEVST